MPSRPTAVADQRRSRITSPRKITASTLVKIGAVKLSAVAWASGISERAVNQQIMLTMPIVARSACSPRRWVRSAPRPWPASQGSIAIRPKTLRKNTTWSGSKVAVSWRIRMIIAANALEAATIQSAARTGAGRPATRVDGDLTARRSMGALCGLARES